MTISEFEKTEKNWPYCKTTHAITQLKFTCSRSTIETLEKVVKYVQS